MKKILVPSTIIVAILLIGFISIKKADAKKLHNEQSNVVLSGQVIDLVSGEYLTGVEVEIEGHDQKVYTDFDGNFEFSNLKPGEYNIIASYISYNKSYVENINLRTNEALSIKLQASR